ncbi:hypothetical protein RvY_19129 [Ramazzottius varieornatus]|uniref:Uncharacterized protein n=1 Tax=Ramazzottius varieornatus TaxID=947166 RepID=A0A1D1W8C3_RAMVA|nr:hypothetical protein RvY_19129 [Ramazzottius varieornatus]
MSEKIDRLAPCLVTLKSLKPAQRRLLLKFCDKNHIRAFEEVLLNIVKNTAKLSETDKKIFQRWKKPLKLLVLKKYPVKYKRDLLLQKGGFFAALLPILVSVVGFVLSR